MSRATPAPCPTSAPSPLTLAHVTHEAVDHLGGIGTVLEGLMSSPVYQRAVGRSILVGPCATHQATTDPAKRLGDHGTVLYSSVDQIDELNLGAKFRPVEWAFNVAIVYGKRVYNPPGEGRQGESEVLLIDVFRSSPDRLNVFKLRLWETFGLDSARYESDWSYEEYTRLAEPAFYALRSLLHDEDLPCILFAHEYMGMPAALAAILDGGDDFRTVFHAHECATARRLVEEHPGHDTMFYNVLDQARAKGLFVEDVFGNLDHVMRHALVSRAHVCDAVIAVGDRTRDEMRFLNAKLSQAPIDVVYNGLPAAKVTPTQKFASRSLLLEYARKLVGYEPNVLLTHVTRPVISKGLWRDVAVCHALDAQFALHGHKGVLFILTSAGGVRRRADVRSMEKAYDWPRQHHNGFPDLVGPEVELHHMVEAFNADHRSIQLVLVNQFGWSADRLGERLPAKMTIADLRRAADVEFGMATYEPFGISPLEPLGAGAICVISNVCGCERFVEHVTAGQPVANVLSADFTQCDAPMTLEALLAMTAQQRDRIESLEARRVADELMRRLPFNDDARRTALLKSGQKLVTQMGWDQVLQASLLPMLTRISNGKSSG